MKSLAWHNDGHRVNVVIDKAVVNVTPSICPYGSSPESPCYHSGVDGCIVNYFVATYGLETNHGTVPASDIIEIAWATDGSKWDVDLVEFYMVPVNDPHFSDWLSSVSSS